MKRSVLLTALLLSVLPAGAATSGYGTITTRYGKAYHECQFMHRYPDGVTFSHRDGAVKIPYAELPESLRSKFQPDPKTVAEYHKRQAELHRAGQERQKLQEVATQERLMDAKMAEARRLAATPVAVTRLQTPSRGSGPISSRPVVSRSGRSGVSYSRLGYSGSRYYSGGYSYGRYPSYGGYSLHVHRPIVSGQWNLGNGIHIGIGGCSLGGGVFGGLHHHY